MSRYSDQRQQKKRRSRSAWQNEDTTPVQLCKGVEIDSSVYELEENRYYTLVLKGLIVYFITAGGIGSFLTAIETDFNQIIFNIVILITAIVCAIMYHSWRSENLGYLVFFAIYAAVMVLFKDYINSGFYAVLNDTTYWASIYFDTEGLQYYNERISNRYVAITIAVSIIGVAENVLLNNYILRRARYMIAIGLSITVNIVAFYMEMEPDTIYTFMVLAGIVMTFVLKCGRHFHLSRRDHIFKRTKKGLTYALDYKSLWQGMLTVAIYVLVMVVGLSAVYDKVYYDAEQEASEDKSVSRDVFQNVIMLGVFGLINYYPSNGGLSTGELGGVSSVRLDYQPDIAVTFTPYSNKTLYIKNFTGQDYEPYKNQWLSVDADSDYTNTYSHEVNALKDAYDDHEQGTAKGYMTITNIEAPALPYQPYYSEGDTKPVFMRQEKTYTYYPREDENATAVSSYVDLEDYLYVPYDNMDTIDSFIEEAGLEEGSAREVAAQVKSYFQENIPYTIRPGATPWRRDFINYFLESNRKGYCAHFASAATLIFREMGIPARYCEGYAISFNEIVDNGEISEGEKYENHFDGYSELGETALVRVEATDADAHAWVEVFDEQEGWIVVEVTPSSTLNEEEDDDFWNSFNNIFGDGEEDLVDRDPADRGGLSLSGADRVMRYAAYVILGIILVIIFVIILVRLYPGIRYRIDYKRAGLSDKLVLRYSRDLRRRSRKDEGLRGRMNYTDQMNYLIPADEVARDRMIDILERAGFSSEEISPEDFQFAMGILEEKID